MKVFGERLRELRIEKNILQKKLAEDFKVAQSSIADWERGVTETDFETLVKLAKYFNVSTDYLLGLED